MLVSMAAAAAPRGLNWDWEDSRGSWGFTDGGWDHFDRKNSKVIKNHYSLICVGLGRGDWVWEVLLRGVVSF